MKNNICTQCGNEFKSWIRIENYDTHEETGYEEEDVCSYECYVDWRNDNREELCN